MKEQLERNESKHGKNATLCCSCGVHTPGEEEQRRRQDRRTSHEKMKTEVFFSGTFFILHALSLPLSSPCLGLHVSLLLFLSPFPGPQDLSTSSPSYLLPSLSFQVCAEKAKESCCFNPKSGMNEPTANNLSILLTTSINVNPCISSSTLLQTNENERRR